MITIFDFGEIMRLNNSKQRDTVYKAVMCLKTHPTADEIYNFVKKDIPNISLGTVYRNLNVLTQIGKIKRISFTDDKDRFDKTLTEHFHFFCEKCGKVYDLPHLDIRKDFKDFDIQINFVDLNIRGLCNKCKNKM